MMLFMERMKQNLWRWEFEGYGLYLTLNRLFAVLYYDSKCLQKLVIGKKVCGINFREDVEELNKLDCLQKASNVVYFRPKPLIRDRVNQNRNFC